MPSLNVPEKLECFLRPKRIKIAVGGRGGAKSMSLADMLLFKMQTESAKVLCGREYQNSIGDSVHSLFESEIDRLGITESFDVMRDEIKCSSGGGTIYKGLARNPESVKSLSGVDIFWGEEAQTFSEKSLELLAPTIREGDSELWFTMNLGSSNDPMSQRYIKPFEKILFRDGYYEDDMHMIVLINYYDNPWFPKELEMERVRDFERLSRARYDHVWLGAYSDEVPDAIIKPEWFDACIDAHLKLGFEPRGAEIVAHDPSDTGSDDKGLSHRHGSVFLELKARDIGTVNEGMDWATGYAIENGVDTFIWDGDGMGASLLRQADIAFRGKGIDYYTFRGSEMPANANAIYDGDTIISASKKKGKTNRKMFRNKRAQFYWMLRDRCYRTYRAVEHNEYANPDELISFSSQIECLDMARAEVCGVPRKQNANGFVQIATKKEMLAMKIESPNIADSIMMNLYTVMDTSKRKVTIQAPKSMGGWV